MPISQLYCEAIKECRRRSVVTEFVFVTEGGRAQTYLLTADRRDVKIALL